VFALFLKKTQLNSQIHYKKLRFRMNKEMLVWIWSH